MTAGDTLIVITTPDPGALPKPFRLEKDLTIGVAEGQEPDDPYLLEEVVDVAVSPAGLICVSDFKAGEVRVFDDMGTFLLEFGRKGEGPGEFSLSNDGDLPVVPLDDGRFSVGDYSPFGLEVFGSDGIYEKSLSYSPIVSGSQRAGRPHFPLLWNTAIDRLVIPWHSFHPRQSPVYDQGGTDIIQFLVTNEGFHQWEWLPVSIEIEGDMYTEEWTSVVIPFAPAIYYTSTGPSTIIWGRSDKYSLTFYDILEASWIRAILNIEPEPVTREHIEAVINYEVSRRPSQSSDRFERIYRHVPYPEHMPFFSDLMGDDEGRVWVLRYMNTIVPGTPGQFLYDVFGARGQWLGVVLSPRHLCEIRAGYAYASGTDGSEGFPVVERFRLFPIMDNEQ